MIYSVICTMFKKHTFENAMQLKLLIVQVGDNNSQHFVVATQDFTLRSMSNVHCDVKGGIGLRR